MLAKALKDGEKSPLLRQAEAGAIPRLASGDPAVLNEQSLTWAKQRCRMMTGRTVRESAVAMLSDTDPRKDAFGTSERSARGSAEDRGGHAEKPGQGRDCRAWGAIADANRDVRLDVLRSIGKVSGSEKRGEQAMRARRPGCKRRS